MTVSIPQGSHLGPFLFILFINDIGTVIRFSKFLLFADDIKIFRSIKSSLNAERLQIDLNAINEWSLRNGLDLNINKCQSISFTRSQDPYYYDYSIDSHILFKPDCMKDLGVWMDPKLKFKIHIHKVCCKASRTLGFLNRSTRSFSDPTAIITLYKTLVLPHFLYCSPIWSPHTKCLMSRLNTIHHSFLRYLAFKSKTPFNRFDHDYNPIAFKFKLLSISSLHIYNDFMLAYKIKHDLFRDVSISSIFTTRTVLYPHRNQRPLIEKICNLNYKFYSITNRLVRSWNSLSTEVANAAIGVFKRSIKYSFFCYE